MKLDWIKRVLPFNQKDSKTAAAVAVIVLVMLVALATRCAAAEEEPYSQFGGGRTVVRGDAPVMDLSYVYPAAGPGDSALEVGTTFIGGSVFKGAEQRNNFALRAAIVDGLGHFRVGLGIAYLQNADAYNGSNLNFNLILGYDVQWVPVTFRVHHFSNGGTRSPNKGRDMLLVYWRFR